MAEELAPWLVADSATPQTEPDNVAPWLKPKEPAKPEVPADPMPNFFQATAQGMRSAAGDVGQTITALSSNGRPEPSNEPQSPAAAPFEWGDVLQPFDKGLPKFGYRIGKSSPALGGGVLGGLAGTGVGTITGGPAGGTVGGLMGGTIGAAAGSAFQTIGPVFAEELKKSPNDPDGAWNRALHEAEISGAFSGASWALFPARFFQGPVKNLAFQAFGIQPGLSVGEQATKNIVSGKSVTDNLGQAYAEGVVSTVVPATGHLALKMAMGDKAPVNAPGSPIGESSVAEFWKRNFQPELVSDKALQADPQFAKYKSATAQERDAIIHRSEENYYKWNSVPEQERLDFMHDIETGVKHFGDPWLQDRADTYRRLLNQAHTDEAVYGSKAGYIDDYFPHIWKDPGKAKAVFDNLQLPQSLGPKWFQKARTYDLIEQGQKSGLELKTSNPEELVTMRLLSGADMRNRMELLNNLRAMGLAEPSAGLPAQSWRNQNPWTEIIAPNRESWRISPDVQPLWENAVNAQGLWSAPGAAGTAFRGWMGLKNAWVPIKLALSAFHPLHVAHINLSNNISRALGETFGRGDQSIGRRLVALPEAAAQSVFDMALAFPLGIPGTKEFGGMRLPSWTNPGKVGREAWLTPKDQQTPAQRAEVDLFNKGGFSPQLSEQLKISAKRKMSDAWNNQPLIKGLPLASYHALRRGMEGLQKPIFERWIPNLKAAAYKREAAALFRRRPDLLNDPVAQGVALRAIGKQIDNRFGEMFYGGLFWNRTMKDAAIGSFLSLGWNLGFAREFIGGALEPAVRQLMAAPTPTRALIRNVTNKSTNAFVYTMTAMAINALMNKAMTGENPEGYDYIFPRIGGNNPDGSPRRITNMFYTREVPMAQKNIEERQSVAGGLTQMLYHKLMVAPFVEGFNNRDYFGYQMYDPNAPGFKQLQQFVLHGMGEQLNPMTITGAKRALQLSGKPSSFADIISNLGDRDVYMPMLGFGPAPAYASKSPIQNRIGYLYSEHVTPASKPFEQKEQMDKRREARDKYMIAKQKGDTEKVAEAAKELAALGVKPTSIAKMQPGTQDIYMFSKLPTQDQMAVLQNANKEEFKRYYPKASRETKFNKELRPYWQKYYGGQ